MSVGLYIHGKIELLVVPLVNSNAVYIVRTATNNSTCHIIDFQMFCKMKILRKVEILIISMHSLVAGKVAKVIDSIFTDKMNYSPFYWSILMRYER